MITLQEMLLLGASLSKAIRKHINFSGNLKELIYPYQNSAFIRNKSIEDGEQRKLLCSSYSKLSSLKHTLVTFDSGSGVCDELIYAIINISKRIKNPYPEEIYISILGIPGKHTFCILHQNKEWHDKYTGGKSRCFVTQHFSELKNSFGENSIVIDPWIYKVTPAIDIIPYHLNFIRAYGVEEYYRGPIWTGETSIKFGICDAQPIPDKMGEVLLDFKKYYTDKLPNQNITSEYGTPFVHAREKLRRKILTVVPPIFFNELKKLFIRIAAESSAYPISFEKNIKKLCFERAIHFIENCLIQNFYPPIEKTESITRALLRVATLVRNGSCPKILDHTNLLVTNTGKALVNISKIREIRYLAEVKGGMNLKPIVDIATRYDCDEHKRHFLLCEYLHQENIQNFIGESAYHLPQSHLLSYLYLSEYKNFCCQQFENELEDRKNETSDEMMDFQAGVESHIL